MRLGSLLWCVASCQLLHVISLEDVADDSAAESEGPVSTPKATEVASGPVKEVLRVLKALAKRVDVRSRRESALYGDFGSFCAKGTGSLEKSLKESQVELPQLQLQMVEADRKRQSLLEEMKVQENEEASCKSAFQSARSIRADELATYQKDLASLTANQKRLQELLATQDGGSGTSLAELSHAGLGGLSSRNGTEEGALQRLTMSSSSSAELLELLQDPGATEGQKIQVLEMLKNMLEGVSKDLSELKAQEAKRKKVFEAMERAKAEELQSLQRSLQEKKERDAGFQKQLALLRLEREDTAAVVDDADKLTKSLKVWCDLRRKEHADMEVKMQEETKSIQSASKLLLAGTGLVAFQPSQSEPLVTFMQVLQRHRSIRERKSNARALRGKASPLNKITKLVDSMTQVLQKDQEDDDLKIQMCKDELASTKSTQTQLSEKEQSKAADVASLSEQLESLERDVAAEKKALARVDWVVATATKLREKEHKHLATSVAQGAAAVDVLHKAANSLEKYLQEGGTLGGTPSGGGDDDSEFGFFTEASKGSDTGPALRSLASVIASVKSEVEQVKLRESTDQAAYVGLVEVAKSSRRKDAFSLTDFVGGQAALAAESQRIQDRQKALKEQMGLTDELAMTLNAECEKLMANFEAKKTMRSQEIDALEAKKKALEASLADVELQ